MAHETSSGQIDCQSKDGTSRIFQKFDGISSSEIQADCTYGGRKAKYTSSCVSAYEEMRDLASRYLEAKNDFCEKMKACGDDLKNCPDSEGQLKKQVAEAHERAASILKQGKIKLHQLVKEAKEDHEHCRSDQRNLDQVSSEHRRHHRHYGRRHRHSDSEGYASVSASGSGSSDEGDGGDAKDGEELGSSGISGPIGGYEYVVDADAVGAQDLEEYHAVLPQILKKQAAAIAEMEAFEGETQSLEAKHSKAATASPAAAATSLTSVKMRNLPPESEEERRKRLGYQAVTGALPPPKPLENPEHDALGSFVGNLGEQPGSSLRDAIRRELASKESRARPTGGKSADIAAANAAADLFSAAKAEGFHGKLEDEAEAAAPVKGPGSRLNVKAAVADMEGQLAELDRSRGILEASSASLFERVREALRRSFTSGRLGKR